MDLVSIVQDGVRWYGETLQHHPMTGSIAQGVAVFTGADIVSQWIEKRSIKKVNWRQVRYTAELSPLYGLGVYGMMRSGNAVGDYIHADPTFEHMIGKAGKGFMMGALGPNLWGHIQNAFFFYNNGAGKSNDYTLKGLAGSYHDFFSGDETPLRNAWKHTKENIPRKEYGVSVLGSLTAWNAVQTLNYSNMPEYAQPAFALLFVVPWVALLTWLSRKKDATVYENKAVSGQKITTAQ